MIDWTGGKKCTEDLRNRSIALDQNGSGWIEGKKAILILRRRGLLERPNSNLSCRETLAVPCKGFKSWRKCEASGHGSRGVYGGERLTKSSSSTRNEQSQHGGSPFDL